MRGGGGSTADRETSASELAGPVDEHCRYVPAEPLRRYVAWYTGYRQRGVPPATHRGLPSPYLTLIFTLDEPLTIVAHPDRGQPPGEFGTLLGGLHSVPALITHAGAQSGIQVALRPLGARALLGRLAGAVRGAGRDPAPPGWPSPGRSRRRSTGGQLGLARAAAGGRRDPGVRTGRRDRLERAAPDRPVPRRDRAGAEGRSTRHQVRPGQEAAGAEADRRWRLPARGPGRRLRLLRPGPPGPGVPRAGRLPAEPVAGRGVPKRPSRELAGRGSLGEPGPVTTPPGREQPRGQQCHPHGNRRSGPRCGRATPGR